MRHLEYKGWKSTRLQLVVLLLLSVSSAYIWGDVSADQWIGFLEWASTAYGLTEVGSKAAVAYREKGNDADT